MRKVVLLMAFLVVFDAGVVCADLSFDYGGSIRLRQEIWDNIVDLGTMNQKDRNFFRLRTSLWGKVDYDKQIEGYLRLTNEMKYYLGPYRFNGNNVEIDELIVDNLYANFKKVFGLPVDIKIGRQDFLGPDMYGEGFLLLDGTPGDGSRTFYFNAAKVRINILDKHRLDLLYITDPATDVYMPSWHRAVSGNPNYIDNKRLLNTSNEQAFVAYGKAQIIDELTFEPYYFYKIEDSFGINTKLKLNTVGGRLVFTYDNWKLRGEFAHQFGQYDGGMDRSGNGGYFFFGRKYDQIALKPEFEFGYVYLSGDDPSTPNEREAWDPLFNRAPFWNELFIYTLINETARNYSGPIPGYWTNLQLLSAKFKLAFTEKTNFTIGYQYLMADQKTSGLNTAMFSNNGTQRGHLPLAFLSHSFMKNLDAFLQLEYFIPGNFYASNATDALFFRWQVQFKF